MTDNRQPASGSGLLSSFLLFFCALSVRLYAQYELSENPSFLYPLVDAGAHHDLALGFQKTDTLSPQLFWRSVFYPLYLGTTYFTTGSSILTAKLFQAFLGALTCLLSHRLGRRYFGPTCGLIAGLITAFYGPLIFWESELVAVSWAAFWSLALLWIALEAKQTGASGFHFGFGLVGGAAVLTRPSFLPFVLLVIIWLAWSARSAPGSNALKRLAIAVAGFGLLTLPTALTARSVADHTSFLPRSAALNLYLGNHPDRCEMLAKRPGEEWRELRELAMAEASAPTGGTRLFRDRLIEHATTHPAAFAAGLFHKLGQLANGREIPRNVDIYLFRDWSPLLGALVWKIGSFGFPFGLLFPLAALGLVLRRRDVPGPLFILVATYPLVIAATFVAGRYRAPLVPALSILAAAGLVELGARLGRQRWRDALVPIGLGAALLFLTNRAAPYCEEEGRFEPEMYLFVALDAAAARDRELALELFDKTLEIDPQWDRAYAELARFYVNQKEFDLALEHYDRAIALSESYRLFHERGTVHSRKKDLQLAMADYDRSIALKPDYAPAYLGRGRIYIVRRMPLRARAELRLSLQYAQSEQDVRAARRTMRQLNSL